VDEPGENVPRTSGAEFVCASVVGVAALTLYIATLQPDVGGPEDTPKFQFLGDVLGSAHPPGYPLYVLLTHAFVQLPVGTIAYRANLFSAVMAALTCVIAYTIARRLRAGRVASIGAALGLASGAAFWRSAVFAEVYSLAAAVVALTVASLLMWGARGRLSALLGAAAVFAIGLGNHLIIVGLVPPCALYVLLKHPRVLTLRLVGALALILCIGVSQYGLIVLRTRQAAPYMESRAESVSELWRVVTAERFAGERFAFGPRVLLTVHLPAALATIGRDLGMIGSALCVIGVARLLIAGSSSALLLLGAAVGLLAMVVNLSGDLQGFVTPLLPLVWPFSATGIEYVGRMLMRVNVGRALPSLAVWTLASSMPVSNVLSNYRFADQSDRKEEGRFLRAFFSQLPNRAGVVAQDYPSDMAIHYMMLTGESDPDRGIGRVGFSGQEVRDALREGRRVFAFATGATVLSTEGFRFERMTVKGPVLEEWLDWMPRGARAFGATAHVPVDLDLQRIGHGAARPIGRLRPHEAFGLVLGTSDAQWRNGDRPVSFRPFDGPVEAASDERGARITRDGHTIAAVGKGLAMAAVKPDGSVLQPLEFQPGEPLQVPFQEAVYEVTGQTACATLSQDWQDIAAAFQTGSWVATLHDRGAATIEIAIPSSGGLKANASVLLGNGSVSRIVRTEQSDGMVMLSTQLIRNGDYRPVFRFALGRIPTIAQARVVAGETKTLTVCQHHPLVSLFASGDRSLLRPDFEAEPYFGAGWSGAERTTSGRQRRGEPAAVLFLPLDPRYSYHAVLELGAPAAGRVDILVNDNPAEACDVNGTVRCEVDLPPESVRLGINTIALGTRNMPAGRSFALHRVELSRQGISRPPS
jgi:hypothetical protein